MATNNFQLGSSVCLVGLTANKYNHHVGRVVQHKPGDERLGIMLHHAVWPPERFLQSNILFIKPKNLRRCPLPQERPLNSTFFGTLPLSFLRSLLDERGWNLPADVVDLVIDNLTIERVAHTDVNVCGCSSTRGDFPVACVLSNAEDEWWISRNGAFARGEGLEYLEFSFGLSPRRISFVGVSIPPMPGGPLSVRCFHLEARIDNLGADDEGNNEAMNKECWIKASPVLITLDVNGLQEFALVPPVATTNIRLVCTQNAMAEKVAKALGDHEAAAHEPEGKIVIAVPSVPLSTWCVGLFKVRFA